MAGTAADRGIVWSDDFLIGIDELDYEHRRLIEDINRLHHDLRAEAGAERVMDTLGSIHARIQAHFALEEHVMASHKYPHYREHKAEHERLLDDYTDFMTRYEHEPNATDLTGIENVLRQWIVEHIIANDKKMSLMVASAKRDRDKPER